MESTARSARLRSLLKSSSDGSGMRERAELALEIEKKLRNAYGIDKSVIHREVEALMRRCTRTKVSEKHLRELEDKIRELDLDRHSMLQAKAKKAPVVTGDEALPSHGNSGDEIPLDDYQVLMVHDRIKHVTNEQEKRNQMLAKKKDIKSTLDAQVAELRDRHEAERKEAEVYGIKLLAESQEYQKEVLRAKNLSIAKNKAEKQILDEELRKVKEAKRMAECAKKRGEARELERIKADLEAEKAKKRAQMLEQQAYVNKVKAENEIAKQERKTLQEKLWEEDRRRDEMYAEKLVAEERKREAHLQQLKMRSSKNQENFMEATRERDDAQREAELRAVQYQQHVYQQECKKAEALEQKRKQDVKAMHASLSQQIARKEREAQEEREAFMEAARVAKIEAEKAREYEMNIKRAARKAALDYKADLDRQVEAKMNSDHGIATKMNTREAVLNASYFRGIKSEPGMEQIVKKNLKPRPHQVLQKKKEERNQYYRENYKPVHYF